jgi:SAM-dependent methyltransferase
MRIHERFPLVKSEEPAWIGVSAMGVGDFTRQAAVYGQARPAYPPELIDQLIQDAGAAAGDSVVDLGAGTGILTQDLVKRGFLVTAVEPNERMRSYAVDTSAIWIDGTFESTRLSDRSQDWAIAAQAFHWADPQEALPEIRRVLRPGRVFTVLWNEKDMEALPILRWTLAAILRHVPDFQEHSQGTDWRSVLESTGDFQFLIRRSVRHIVPMTCDRFVNLWRSHHWMQHLAKPGAFEAFITELERRLSDERIDAIDFPYECHSWSARRRD